MNGRQESLGFVRFFMINQSQYIRPVRSSLMAHLKYKFWSPRLKAFLMEKS
jgi:hypothetical protein